MPVNLYGAQGNAFRHHLQDLARFSEGSLFMGMIMHHHA